MPLFCRATTPMASPRSAGEQEDASIQPDKVDVPSSKGPTNLSATKATSVPPEVAEHVSVKQSGEKQLHLQKAERQHQ